VIYLDHNATTPLDPRVLEAIFPYLTEEYGNASSYHQMGRAAREAVEAARATTAACLGARPEEIVFTAGGTEADNLALRGVTAALRHRGRHLVTVATEHHAVLRTCESLADDGWEVTLLPVDGEGLVEPEAVKRALRPDTVLVSVMAANNETGVIQPLARISEVARQAGVLIHTDAVQAVGKIPVDMEGLGVDLLSLAGHKVYGPKGVGALYVRSGTPLISPLTGGPHEKGRRAGTENVAAIVGLAEALRLRREAGPSEAVHLAALRDRLEQGVLARLDGVKVNSGSGPRVANTSSLSFRAVDGESVLLHLDLAGICAATGSACTTDSPEPSHVLLAMGLEPRLAQGTVRFSLGHGNTAAQIDQVVEALVEIVPRLRAISTFT
jgi:cysteine desulfurase